MWAKCPRVGTRSAVASDQRGWTGLSPASVASVSLNQTWSVTLHCPNGVDASGTAWLETKQNDQATPKTPVYCKGQYPDQTKTFSIQPDPTQPTPVNYSAALTGPNGTFCPAHGGHGVTNTCSFNVTVKFG
jgi:hypothetical protein